MGAHNVRLQLHENIIINEICVSHADHFVRDEQQLLVIFRVFDC